MIVDYEKPLSALLEHLKELVGPRAYARHDIRFEREGYGDRKQRVYASMRDEPPVELAGSEIVKTRTDDGFKFYLEDGAWVLVRMSGTEPLMRVYSEAQTPDRVDTLLAALENYLDVTAQPVGAH
jgi:phosphomannomutase